MVDPKGIQTNPSQSTSTNKSVKCFKCQGQGHIASQCPTKRTMMIEENEYVEVENHDGYVEEEAEEIPSGDFFMIRRFLGNQAKEEESNQRETLFHTRCLVQGKVCSLIIWR